MTYVKEYFKTLIEFLALMGVLTLFINAFQSDLTAIYLLHLSVVCALAGPVGALINGKKA
jgi:hypothetical protein